MNRQMIMASAAILLLSAIAGAQQWDGDGYTYRLKGCYVTGEQVRCDFTFVLTQGTTTELSEMIDTYQAVTTNGLTLTASKVSVGGKSFGGQYVGSKATAYKDAPVQVSVLFDVTNAGSFKVLAVNKQPMNNVPIAKSAAAIAQAAPAPITTPPVVATPSPSAGVPTGFAIKLSNCKVNKGIYTCTATLTPTR